MKRKIIALLTLIMILGTTVIGCSDAEVVSSNLTTQADKFQILRKITFINTITDETLYTVEGNFSINADTEDNQLEITAKVGEDKYEKHFLGLSPTTVYIVEQLEWNETDKYRFDIVIKPSALIPDVEVE
ncbi:hypothetical protein M2146_001173 [Lachnospiraceae bacterium PF1-22]